MKTFQHILLFLFVLSILGGCAHQQVTGEIKDPPGRPSFGIKFGPRVIQIPRGLGLQAGSGILIEIVFPFFPAEQAGLMNGDILIAIEGEFFRGLSDKDVPIIIKRLADLQVGRKTRWKILRLQPKGHYEVLDLNKNNISFKKDLFDSEMPPLDQVFQHSLTPQKVIAHWVNNPLVFDVELPVVGKKWSYGNLNPTAVSNQTLWSDDKELATAISRIPMTVSQSQDFLDTQKRIFDLNEQVDPRRLPVVTKLQQNPLQIQSYQNAILKIGHSCKQNDVATCFKEIAFAAGFLEFAGQKANSGRRQFQDLKDLFSYFSSQIEVADLQVELAFRDLLDEERSFLKEYVPEILAQLTRGVYLHEDIELSRRAKSLRALRLLQKIHVENLISSGLVLAQLMNVELVAQIQRFATKEDLEKEKIFELQTKAGKIILGGIGANDYKECSLNSCRLIVDLGGSDRYPDVSANIIDFSGDDFYESAMPWTFAAGIFSSRFVWDRAGSDRYVCADGCLGSALLGASLFVDDAGNDFYQNSRFGIGQAVTGISLFVDRRGNDQYQSQMMSQGVGIAGGIGGLFDFEGDDFYYAKGGEPSSYRDPGEFDSWSQGVGLGLRNFVSGGWGFLYDRNGKDKLEAGTFSQGGGYYFGLGMLMNEGESDDLYRGARYTQGFSCHYAVGLFYEAGGDDRYQSPSFVGQGMAWDFGVTLFQDKNGNDEYKTCEHCLGVASQNSLAFFIDENGRDRYLGRDLPYSERRYNDYHGGQSFGIFWDKGKKDDQYQLFQNNSWQRGAGWHQLIDE